MNADEKKVITKAEILFVFSMIVHLWMLPYFSSMPYFPGISAGFVLAAENLFDGNGFTETVDTDRGMELRPAIWSPPIYSFSIFLSFLAFGKNVAAFKIIQIILLSLVPPLLYVFSRTRLGEKYALMLSLITIMYLPNLRLSATVLSEVLFGPMLLVSAILFLNKKHFWSGIVFGIASLTRDFGIMFALAFIVYAFVSKQEKPAKVALVFLAALFIVVFPWMARNEYYYGHFVISAPKTGISLWEGIGEFDTAGKFGAPWGDENLVKSENATSFLYPDPFSRDSARIQKALNVIEHNPVWYVGVMAKRVPQFLFMNIGAGITNSFKGTNIYNFDITQIPSLIPLLVSEKGSFVLATMWLEQIIVYLFALAGAYLIIKQKKTEFYLFILIILVMMTNIAHHVEPRYFVPANYFVLFIAMYGIKETGFLNKLTIAASKVAQYGKRLRIQIPRL